MAKQYNCTKCPAYCCSYSRIIVSHADIKRLAKHHGVTVVVAKERFTKKGLERGERVLRHQEDEHYKSICRFLNTETRQCTIYAARPKICREFPGANRCGYYDFLKFEREAQEDPDLVATTDN
jgi:uncharacterized protein